MQSFHLGGKGLEHCIESYHLEVNFLTVFISIGQLGLWVQHRFTDLLVIDPSQ